MFNQKEYFKTKKILSKIKDGVNVSFNERLYLQNRKVSDRSRIYFQRKNNFYKFHLQMQEISMERED